MTNKKKILLQLSEEDTEFFIEVLDQADVGVLLNKEIADKSPVDADYILLPFKEYKLILEQRNEMWEAFWDLKRFVGSVVGYPEVLLSGMEGDLTENQEKFLQSLHTNGKVMKTIIYDKLSMLVEYARQSQETHKEDAADD